MKTLVLIGALLASQPAAAPPSAKAVTDAEAALEGRWAIGNAPGKGACPSGGYQQTQLEFEFQRSGGRMLVFEPPDLYTPVAFGAAAVVDGKLALTIRKPDGSAGPVVGVRQVAPDQIALDGKPGADGKPTTETAYRCLAPDRSVTAALSTADVLALTPAITGGNWFPEIKAGETVADVCAGRVRRDPMQLTRRSLQFELLGPAHYWVFGYGFGSDHPLDFDRVQGARKDASGAVVLSLVETIGPHGSGHVYDLTILDHGDRIEIPELTGAFARCFPTPSPPSTSHPSAG